MSSNSQMSGIYPFHTGAEAEQYSFFRIPTVLFSDPDLKNLSTDAKLLYGLLLDRMGLSVRNGWLDEENHVYIYYTVEEIQESMGCGNKKAGALLAELDDRKGIGLISRVRQGLGRPDRIYVRKCIRQEDEPEQKEEAGQEEEHVQTCHNDTSRHVETTSLDMSEPETTSRTCQNDTSRRVETTSLDMSKGHTNHTDNNHTEKNQTESSQSVQGELLPLGREEYAMLAEVYDDVDGLIDKALSRVKVRESKDRIRHPYRYILRVAENEHWPTRAEIEEAKDRARKGREEQARREALMEAEKKAEVAAARRAGRIPTACFGLEGGA